MTVGDGGAGAVGDGGADNACPPPLVLRTALKYDDVGQGEGDNMVGGFGEVVYGKAGASCMMALMSTRRALRGAARDLHAAQMHRSATSMWAGGSVGIVAMWRPAAVL
jgi:hypothetical protein